MVLCELNYRAHNLIFSNVRLHSYPHGFGGYEIVFFMSANFHTLLDIIKHEGGKKQLENATFKSFQSLPIINRLMCLFG